MTATARRSADLTLHTGAYCRVGCRPRDAREGPAPRPSLHEVRRVQPGEDLGLGGREAGMLQALQAALVHVHEKLLEGLVPARHEAGLVAARGQDGQRVLNGCRYAVDSV